MPAASRADSEPKVLGRVRYVRAAVQTHFSEFFEIERVVFLCQLRNRFVVLRLLVWK